MATVVKTTSETSASQVTTDKTTVGDPQYYALQVSYPSLGINETVGVTLTGVMSFNDLMEALSLEINNNAQLGTVMLATFVPFEEDYEGLARVRMESIDEDDLYILQVLDEGGVSRLLIDYFRPVVPMWATDAASLKVQPPENKKEIGWGLSGNTKGERPPLEYFNWFWNICGSWFNYLDVIVQRVLAMEDRIETRWKQVYHVVPVNYRVGWLKFGETGFSNTVYTVGSAVGPLDVYVSQQNDNFYAELDFGAVGDGVFNSPPIASGTYHPCLVYCESDGTVIGNGAFPAWATETADNTIANALAKWKMVPLSVDIEASTTSPNWDKLDYVGYVEHGRIRIDMKEANASLDYEGLTTDSLPNTQYQNRGPIFNGQDNGGNYARIKVFPFVKGLGYKSVMASPHVPLPLY